VTQDEIRWSPEELLTEAISLLTGTEMKGSWPRAVALLGRQALETALDRLWIQAAPGMESCSTHAQFLCLSTYLNDQALAAHVAHAWMALSRATHHHSYELSPSHDELARWLATIDEFIELTGTSESDG
jgi:hypothetical protein